MTAPLVEVQDLKVHFPQGGANWLGQHARFLRAVDGVSFAIHPGETLGLVGESGSGKTTLGRAILRAVEPTGGRVTFRRNGEAIDVTGLDRRGLRGLWRHMQLVFQDPYASLNPRMTVRDIVGESLVANRLGSAAEVKERVVDIVRRCGLSVEHLGRYPHAFSGGQRQRIAIARALIMRPEFIVCDEPVSALDVSIQAQVLRLLKELQAEFGLTYLFIAHDLAVVAHASDRVAVMYLGQIVELAPTRQLYFQPRHPYTDALLSAIPAPDPDVPMRPLLLVGERPDPSNPPDGCRFHTRCRYAVARCRVDMPVLRTLGDGHQVACHLAEDLALKGAHDQSAHLVPA